MAIEVEIALVRSLMGPLETWWTDTQIMSTAITLPAMLALEALCPTVEFLAGTEEEDIAKLALANLVAAQLLQTTPNVASSRMGDTQVSYSSDAMVQRGQQMVAQAHALLGDVCPVPKPSVRVFRLAPGGRAS